MKNILLQNILIVLSICLIGRTVVSAQDKKYIFYKPFSYGSEAMFNPIGVLMNGGLDVLQSYNSSTRADDILWNVQATSVWRSVSSPAYYINLFGWNKFLNQEVIPASVDITKAQWAPNYTLHLIGGGTYSAGMTMQYSPFGFGIYAPH